MLLTTAQSVYERAKYSTSALQFRAIEDELNRIAGNLANQGENSSARSVWNMVSSVQDMAVRTASSVSSDEWERGII